MKRPIVILSALFSLGLAQAQDLSIVGMWQQVINVNQGSITLGPNGKVFMSDGRIFGYFLNPSDFENYSNYGFGPWFFGNYTVTSDSTYTEDVYLHSSKEWEGTLKFKYKILNNHCLLTQYDHTFPDGSTRNITELWIKVSKGKDEQKKVIDIVKENWNVYLEKAKVLFGREPKK